MEKSAARARARDEIKIAEMSRHLSSRSQVQQRPGAVSVAQRPSRKVRRREFPFFPARARVGVFASASALVRHPREIRIRGTDSGKVTGFRLEPPLLLYTVDRNEIALFVITVAPGASARSRREVYVRKRVEEQSDVSSNEKRRGKYMRLKRETIEVAGYRRVIQSIKRYIDARYAAPRESYVYM